jgi:hypothetical protein
MKWYNIVILAAIAGVGAYMAYAICHIAIFDFDDFLYVFLYLNFRTGPLQ